MKIILAGGAGFIGTNLLHSLLCKREVDEIVIIDTLYSCGLGYVEEVLGKSFPDQSPVSTIQMEKDGCGKKIHLIMKSVTESGEWRRICDHADLFIHTAELPHLREHSEEMIYTNIIFTESSLQLAAECTCGGYVYLSSVAVYGEGKSNGISSENTPLKPVSDYGIAKKESEKICQQMQLRNGIPVAILRLSNPIGRFSAHNEQLVSSVMKNLLTGSDIVICGDGNQMRDFVHIDDIVRAVWEVALRNKEERVYNIGSGESRSVSMMIDLIMEITGLKSKVVKLPERPGSIRYSYISISKIKEEIGFVPIHKIEDGIKELYEQIKFPQ